MKGNAIITQPGQVGEEQKEQHQRIVKAGLFFGIGMGLFSALIFGILFEISSQDGIDGLLLGPGLGLAVGLVSGVLFSLVMAFLSKYHTKKFEPLRRQMAREHRIVFEGGANHFMNKEGVGGWLFLTPEFLFFKSHRLNIQNHELTIPMSLIKSATPCKLSYFATGLKVEKINGTWETFVVNRNNEWVVKINNSIDDLCPQGAKGVVNGTVEWRTSGEVTRHENDPGKKIRLWLWFVLTFSISIANSMVISLLDLNGSQIIITTMISIIIVIALIWILVRHRGGPTPTIKNDGNRS